MERTFENLKNILIEKYKEFDNASRYYDKNAEIEHDEERKKHFEDYAQEMFSKRFEIEMILKKFYTMCEIENML